MDRPTDYTENDAWRDDAARDSHDSADAERARECEEADLRAQEREIELMVEGRAVAPRGYARIAPGIAVRVGKRRAF